MKQFLKLPFLTLTAALLSAGSVHALERASHLQTAQAGDEEERGPREAPPESAPEPDGGAAAPQPDAEERRERPAARQRGEDEGERPKRPQRQDVEGGEPPSERPARTRRDTDAPPPPAARDDEAPPKKADDAAPPAEAQPVEKQPAEKKAPRAEEPPSEPKAAPRDADAPEAEPKARREPGPRKKADPAPAPEAQEPPAKSEPVPEAPEPESKEPPAAPPRAPKGPDAEAPRRAPGQAAEPAPAPAAPSEVKDLKELKEERKQRTEEGGKRVVIEEPDNRVIVKEGGRAIIRADETQRFRRLGGDVRREKRNGLDISISVRPGGIEIFTESDERGRPLRRYRRDRDGREVILFDNRDYYRRHRDGAFVDAIVDLPPPRVTIPRDHYIVDYEEASDDDVYEALSAPPIERLERTYSLEEVRRSPGLRDRMRRIDLDVINFDFGAWDVASSQYPALARIAKAMNRVIERNSDEVFLVEGHTDAVGSDEDNLSLSDRRAESVAIILTEEFAVPPENITTQGYGEQYLKVDTQAAELQNRRVAVRRITPLLSRGN